MRNIEFEAKQLLIERLDNDLLEQVRKLFDGKSPQIVDVYRLQELAEVHCYLKTAHQKEISETLGKETIDMFNPSDTRGSQRRMGVNYQKLGKELMSTDELAVMDGGKCILQVQGVRPFFSDKYDISRHPQYKYLSDANPKNAFDIEKYLSHRLTVRPEDVFECCELDAPPAPGNAAL